MFTVDFRPRLDGFPYEPLVYGGSVGALTIYADRARATAPVATIATNVRAAPGVYRFDVPDLPDGTYYTRVSWRKDAGTAPYEALDRFTLPILDPDIARVRRLTNEPNEDTFTDSEIAARLDATRSLSGRADVNAVAADVWEEKAGLISHGPDGGAPGRVASVKTGDQQVNFDSSGILSSADMLAKARYFRSRSFVRSVPIAHDRRRYARPFTERDEQYDVGLGHLYGDLSLGTFYGSAR